MKINPTIFREYDIRGIAGDKFKPETIAEYEKWYGPFPGITITLEVAEAIGRAYGSIIRRGGGKEVLVGYEIRPFAKELTRAFIKGIRRTGCGVIDLGVSLTPIVYFLTVYGKYDGGVNVTGSHNVYFYNGFKLMRSGSAPIFGTELTDMHHAIEREDFVEEREGGYRKIDGYGEYKKYFLDHNRFAKKFKIVIDCGNGSAGVFAPDLFRSLGSEVVELFTEPDATFPNHVPDPQMPQNLVELGRKVKETGADLGIAFDADGDRVGFVSETGEYVDTDLVLLLLTRDVLGRNPGKKIMIEVKCSQLFAELVPRYGGEVLMHRTGHAPFKHTMQHDDDIILGGEASGHFYFRENYFRIDDGLWAAGQVLQILSRAAGNFSHLFAEFPRRVRTPEIKLPCRDEDKFEVVAKVKAVLESKYSAVTIDGVRLKLSPTGWGLVRSSNTSPYLSLRFEGETDEEVLRAKNIIADELEKFDSVGDRLNRKEVATLTGRLGWV